MSFSSSTWYAHRAPPPRPAASAGTRADRALKSISPPQVSNPPTKALDHILKDEDWRPIDAIAELSCASPLLPPLIRRPTFLHAAQHYVVCADGTKPSDPGGGGDRCP